MLDSWDVVWRRKDRAKRRSSVVVRQMVIGNGRREEIRGETEAEVESLNILQHNSPSIPPLPNPLPPASSRLS